MSEIARQLSEIRAQIGEACARSGRELDAAQLIAVSKTFPANAIQEAIVAGQRLFGESRLQEAEPKIRELPVKLEWHFIGRVQRNKVRKILPLFPYIHAVDSLKLATYMNGVADELGLYPQVFLEVDLAGEESKGGFRPDELRGEIGAIIELSHLHVVGLMAVPPAASVAEESRHWFRMLRELRDELQSDFSVCLPSLSMGMSGDFEIAVEEGATHVRVGSAIFGKRAYRVEGEIG